MTSKQLTQKLSKEDVQEVKDADKQTEDRRIATAQILEAIQGKRPVPHAPPTRRIFRSKTLASTTTRHSRRHFANC